jgi:hypothetical protein
VQLRLNVAATDVMIVRTAGTQSAQPPNVLSVFGSSLMKLLLCVHERILSNIRSEVLKAMFWVVTACGLVGR